MNIDYNQGEASQQHKITGNGDAAMRWRRVEYEMGGDDERLDCCVRAYAVAACVSYKTAHELLRRHGRKNGHTIRMMDFKVALNEKFPFASYEIPPKITLAKFVKLHSIGHYIVMTKNHAFAVYDGIVYDWEPHPHYRIRYSWRLV